MQITASQTTALMTCIRLPCQSSGWLGVNLWNTLWKGPLSVNLWNTLWRGPLGVYLWNTLYEGVCWVWICETLYEGVHWAWICETHFMKGSIGHESAKHTLWSPLGLNLWNTLWRVTPWTVACSPTCHHDITIPLRLTLTCSTLQAPCNTNNKTVMHTTVFLSPPYPPPPPPHSRNIHNGPVFKINQARERGGRQRCGLISRPWTSQTPLTSEHNRHFMNRVWEW